MPFLKREASEGERNRRVRDCDTVGEGGGCNTPQQGMRSGDRKAGKGAMAAARFKPLVMTTSGSASASSTPQMLQPKITALFGATPRTVPKVFGAMGQRSSYLPSSQPSGQGYSAAFVPTQTPPPQEPARWAANSHNDYFPSSLAAQSAPESRAVESEPPDGQRAAVEPSLISPRRKSKLSLNHTVQTPERRELSRVCNDGPAASSSNSSSEGNRADRAKKLCRASEQDRRLRLREEEDIRILARWEQEDQMVTLCTSRVPLDISRHESEGLSGAGSVGNEHSQHGTESQSPLMGISADADREDAIPARSWMERKELPSTQRVPDVVELLESSQDVEEFGDGANVRGMGGGGNEDDDWGEDWEEDGVVIEAPPDDEDLGEYARPRTPVGVSSGFDPSLPFASNLGQHADGVEDEEDEEFQRLLRKRGGLLPEQTVRAQESPRRVRERNGDVDIDSTRESHDEEEEDDVGKEGRKGSGSRGSRTGFWMTERFGPHKHQYKRVYVDANGRKHSGKVIYCLKRRHESLCKV